MHDDIDKYLAEVEARCEAATDGPWDITARPSATQNPEVGCKDGAVAVAWQLSLPLIKGRRPRNADFIAHARTDIPRLVALVGFYRDKSRTLVEYLERVAADYENHVEDGHTYPMQNALEHAKKFLAELPKGPQP